MRSPKDFFKPLAVGAPAPLREIPVRPSRMIHFFPASNPKMRAKLPDMVGTVDVGKDPGPGTGGPWSPESQRERQRACDGAQPPSRPRSAAR